MDKKTAAQAASSIISDAIGKAKADPAAQPGGAQRAAGIVKRPNAYFIDPKTITRRAGWNPRFDMGEIELLAESIKTLLARSVASGGLLNDIRVKRLPEPTAAGHVFELVDGDRRLTAIELLMSRGVSFPEGIPAKIEARDAEDLDLLINMFTANTGKPFLPLEEAHAFKRMKDAGMTLAQIEKATGRSDNSIVGALALLDADPALVDGVKSGKIGSGLAKSIAVNARGDRAKQAELAREAIEAGKDKGKRKAVLRKVDDARRAKAAKKGVKLKMRALSDDQLSAIGAKMSEVLTAQMADNDLPADCDMDAWVRSEKDLRCAFTLGVMYALKAAAGMPVQLVIKD